jgi:hypothetical protein
MSRHGSEAYRERKAREAAQRAERDSRRRYYIRFQWRRTEEDTRYGRQDWRRYRQFAVWPMLFRTSEEAWDHLHGVPDMFANLRGTKRKLSCSVECVLLPKP